MTPDEKTAVIDLLTLAHANALDRSIIPFRAACLELRCMRTPVATIAESAIAKVRVARYGDRKPPPHEYPDVILAAIEYIESGAIPVA